MLQRIGSIALGLHFGLVILHNIGNMQLPSIGVKSAVDPILHSVQRLHNQPVLHHYAQLAGIHGCYGFYSPQVGSIYSSRFEVRDPRADTVLTLSYPGLRSTPSKLRYCTLLEALEGWRHEGNQSKTPLLARATAHSLYKYVQRQYPNNKIHLLIYSTRIPSLRDIRSKKQTNKLIIPIYEQPNQQKRILCHSEHFL
ncbi:hypothetical protein [Sphingobacterium faecale]|uniref:Uncharacterized protein n=1 Tax=Sphingobacterium faecale TaxID=2803775 RepID=A0ABS1QYL6_9SPHI|nr:hypothetical protein [Sphingobacterium faecale]MBL1407521.1 hypothetical protein [Sphingobacterium faecale]